MRICFDLDGTICTFRPDMDYENAEPIPEMIKRVCWHKRRGDYVVIQTARGDGTGKDWSEVTARQLWDWAVPYDELRYGKAWADIYIDDRAINAHDYRASHWADLLALRCGL